MMMIKSLVLSLLALPVVVAFVVPVGHRATSIRRQPTAICSSSSSSSSSKTSIDDARERFEELVGPGRFASRDNGRAGSSHSSNTSNVGEYPDSNQTNGDTEVTGVPQDPEWTKESYVPPPLTTSSAQRRLVEIDLLESLRDSDDAVDQLMHLWLHERDRSSASVLVAMEESVSPGMWKEEQDLLGMIDEYGLDWSEPAARLATLLYYKDRYLESYEWARKVLVVKPWHFEVINVQIGNCLQLERKAELWKFARQALPLLNEARGNAKRKQWVDRAVHDAWEQYHQAADVARDEPDTFSDDAWQ